VVLQRGRSIDGSWTVGALRSHPGALLAATVEESRVVVAVRGEMRVITATAPRAAALPFDPAVLASAVYASTVGGQFVDGLPAHLTVRAGGQAASVRLDSKRIDR
jgi:hypothetical protein